MVSLLHHRLHLSPEDKFNLRNVTFMFRKINFSLFFQLGVGKNSGSFGDSRSPTRYQVGICVCFTTLQKEAKLLVHIISIFGYSAELDFTNKRIRRLILILPVGSLFVTVIK